jgi:hypothetical protein
MLPCYFSAPRYTSTSFQYVALCVEKGQVSELLAFWIGHASFLYLSWQTFHDSQPVPTSPSSWWDHLSLVQLEYPISKMFGTIKYFRFLDFALWNICIYDETSYGGDPSLNLKFVSYIPYTHNLMVIAYNIL